MAFFKDTADLQQVLGGFFESIRYNQEMGARVREAQVLATFYFSDPDLIVTIDAVNAPDPGTHFNINYGQPPFQAPMSITLSADNAHRFWQGKLNVLLALSQKQIQINGSGSKLLALLPAVSPSFQLYRAYLTQIGRQDLLV